MDIQHAIEKRRSIRSYSKSLGNSEIKDKLSRYLETVKGPFDVNVRFKIIDIKDLNSNSDLKLGTYGVIRGTKTFIGTAVEKNVRAMEQLGYSLEKVVIYATSLGLGTCWLGGTFKRGEFAKAIGLKEGELIPVITPIGYPAENRSLLDSIMTFAAGSKNRKDFKELFFNRDFASPIVKEKLDPNYQSALEAVRLAPSASNKQPWRIVKIENTFHFFVCRTKGYGSSVDFDIQRLDIGIAMYHFQAVLKELGISGSWEAVNQSILLPENTEYIISFVISSK